MSDNNTYTLPAGMVEGMIDALANLPYGQVFQLIHAVSVEVHNQREAQEPKIITGDKP